jgi:hypothetical protein
VKLLICGLLLATLAAYSPALSGSMLWDDNRHITRAALRSLTGLWRIWSDFRATQQYYPVTHSVFWLEHRLWGDDTFGYHLAGRNVPGLIDSQCSYPMPVFRRK